MRTEPKSSSVAVTKRQPRVIVPRILSSIVKPLPAKSIHIVRLKVRRLGSGEALPRCKVFNFKDSLGASK